jgi:rRNA maturation endonuclease Nob1
MGVTKARHSKPGVETAEFYRETKWCAQCERYVRFLMSVNHSYCIDCGGRVKLMSGDDTQRFGDAVQRHKWQAS